MTSIYEKAINQLLGANEELSSTDRAAVLGLILGSLTTEERRKAAGKIADLEARVKKVERWARP